MSKQNGIFITFEGVDGVGKTTQIQRLQRYLQEQGRNVLVTREPGGSDLGTNLRNILLHSTSDISVKAEALLFAADRAQHVYEVIRPALERGDVVISDRYIDSSLAYQASGRELSLEEIRSMSMWGTDSLLPDRTYLLDLDPKISHTRLQHDEDRMEAAGEDFQKRTRLAFLELAQKEPERIHVVDAAQSIEEVWQHICADVNTLL